MCGRYKISTPGDELWETFDVHGNDMPPLVPRWNVAPTQLIPVIRRPHQGELLRWGIQGPNPKAGGINVRVESLAAPMYREAIRQRRCLILADGYYEWRVVSAPGAKKLVKQPYLVQRIDHEPFAFAGIWQEQVTPDGELIPAVAILTTVPHGAAAEVHDRMPLILPMASTSQWLDPNARYKDLLEPDWQSLQIVPVSPLVNSPKNEGEAVAEPVAAVPPVE